MKLISPKDRIRQLAATMAAGVDRSYLEPPKSLQDRPYYALVDWESQRRLNARAGVGSLLFANRVVPPFCNVSTWDISIPWVREHLEQEEEYRRSRGVEGRSYPSFAAQSLKNQSINQ